jgi:1,4-alpha-glucan branching enzyme
MNAPSGHSGMGAVLHDGGCTFRVWAPNADEASVAGNFIGSPVRLARDAGEGPGRTYWSAFAQGVRAGDEYRYHLKNGAHAFSKMDPYGRDATHSAGNSIVCDLGFDWGSEGWGMPDWNELVIYEMHIGSFNVLPGGRLGTFQTVIERLRDLQDLGINAVQVMPAFEFDFEESMGYNPALPFAIESAYGEPKVVQEFVKQAHRCGIAVYLRRRLQPFRPGGPRALPLAVRWLEREW